MSISITINGRKITPPQSSSCASSLYVLGHAFYAATPKKGMHTNRIEVSKEDRRILFAMSSRPGFGLVIVLVV